MQGIRVRAFGRVTVSNGEILFEDRMVETVLTVDDQGEPQRVSMERKREPQRLGIKNRKGVRYRPGRREFEALPWTSE